MKTLIAILGVVCMVSTTEAALNNPELLAINIIAKYEGFYPTPYTCPGGHLTIGYGFADPEIVARKSITRKEADRILGKLVRADLKFINDRLPDLTAKQQAAVCSFIHNFGRQGFLDSTYYKCLKAGKFESARIECMKWVHSKRWNKLKRRYDVVTLPGLVARREHECRWL